MCIGYGFGDAHINDVLRGWLEFTPERRLKIINPGIQEVPAFLIHLLPQIVLIKSSATDYLDAQAGIVRSAREKKGSRLSALLRALGNEQAVLKMLGFLRKLNGQMAEALAEKLKTLPAAEGQQDLTGLGDPNALAEQWAAEIRPSGEELIDQLLSHVEASEGTSVD